VFAQRYSLAANAQIECLVNHVGRNGFITEPGHGSRDGLHFRSQTAPEYTVVRFRTALDQVTGAGDELDRVDVDFAANNRGDGLDIGTCDSRLFNHENTR